MKLVCLFSIVLLWGCLPSENKSELKKGINLTRYVDPYIGTGFHGHVFLGANVPFGAVQLGSNVWVNLFIALIFLLEGDAYRLAIASGPLTEEDRGELMHVRLCCGFVISASRGLKPKKRASK